MIVDVLQHYYAYPPSFQQQHLRDSVMSATPSTAKANMMNILKNMATVGIGAVMAVTFTIGAGSATHASMPSEPAGHSVTEHRTNPDITNVPERQAQKNDASRDEVCVRPVKAGAKPYSGRPTEDECARMHNADMRYCESLPAKNKHDINLRRKCWEQANVDYANCLRQATPMSEKAKEDKRA